MKVFSVFFIVLFPLALMANEMRQILNLNGYWRFCIGDNPEYASVSYNDAHWVKIRVPGRWEDQGYPEYDGYAWYRYSFKLHSVDPNSNLYLIVGYIDDVDAVYVNGKFLKRTGQFPPYYRSAYNEERVYMIPPEMLHSDEENVIAVRVYDGGGEGGIVKGRVGLFVKSTVRLKINLSGQWKFTEGDNVAYSQYDFDDSKWTDLRVPGIWESEGIDYNGYAWYRKEVSIRNIYDDKKLILILGKIDDMDETYFNGVKIGRMARFPDEGYTDGYFDFYRNDRYYYIPAHLIKWNEKNSIAVRVYDVTGDGGIYDGPVGITTQDELIKFKQRYR